LASPAQSLNAEQSEQRGNRYDRDHERWVE
jgi:hypothetical protein